jgi:hypothetical protein
MRTKAGMISSFIREKITVAVMMTTGFGEQRNTKDIAVFTGITE